MRVRGRAVLTAGIDVGTSGVRAVLLDTATGRIHGHAEVTLGAGSRSDGGHLIDDTAVIAAARESLAAACARAGRRPAAISVAGAAGTLCFRDARGAPCAAAVAYDDTRFGSGLERVLAWKERLPQAAHVVPIGDAVLEALGSEAGGTDWTNALKLGWDPRALSWPEPARALEEAAFLPKVEPPGAPAGRATFAAAPGAVLARGATDSCAMHVAAAGLEPGTWSVSLGTTVTWKATLDGPEPAVLDSLPRGSYGHRLADDAWLAAAAGNSGGGALLTLESSSACSLADLDRAARVPTGFAAYPLARPGERFPVADTAFAGFGLPHPADRRLHAAILEGIAFVVRLGLDRLVAAGVPAPSAIQVTGGGARSGVWMDVLASVVQLAMRPQPDAGPAAGAALLACAAAEGAPVRDGLRRLHGPPAPAPRLPIQSVARILDERYAAFCDMISAVQRRQDDRRPPHAA